MVFTMSLRVQVRSKRCALGLSFFRDERQYTEQSTDNQADQEKVILIYQQHYYGPDSFPHCIYKDIWFYAHSKGHL